MIMMRALALGLTLNAAPLAGCGFQAGVIGDANTIDGVAPAAGPMLLRPAMDQVLPATRAFRLWQDVGAATGRAIRDYEVCSTTGAMDSIDEPSECPGGTTASKTHSVLDPLAAGTAYLWKVRTRFDDDSYSAWSTVQVFSTDNSLVAWWRLNGNATDSGPAGIYGTPQNGAGFAAGLDGQALSADGVNDYIDLGIDPALHLNGPLSVSAWINPNGIPAAADSGILNQGSLNYALTYHTDGRVYFYIGDGGNNLNADASPGTWHQVAGTFDGTTNVDGMKLYFDAVLAGMRASSVPSTGATGSTAIGRYAASYFRGLIDDVILYNVALTESAVANDYCAAQAAGGVDPLPAPCQP
jgi:hypothetical protein